ncbi:MAG: hypothetical protein OXH70_00225 [Acidobacteria bacterium]|nr:hypothetical protein [Acidobacteriota bacterium]
MRENREVLAQLTDAERAIARAAHGIPEAAHEARNEIDALADTARQMRTALNRAGWVLLTVGFIGGLWPAALWSPWSCEASLCGAERHAKGTSDSTSPLVRPTILSRRSAKPLDDHTGR